MDPRTLIPALEYEDTPPPMMAGLQDIVMKALNTDANVLKEAAAEAEKYRKEAEKTALERKKPDRSVPQETYDRKLNELETQAGTAFAQDTQLIYDLETRKREYRHESKDDSHVKYHQKRFPGAKDLLFFTDREGVRRAAWNVQLTNEEGADLEKQEIGELLKTATTEEDKAYYTKLLTIIDEEKKAGRTVADKKYDAGFIGRLIGNTRTVRSMIDDVAGQVDVKEARERLKANAELVPKIRADLEKRYGPAIKAHEERVAEYAKKKAEQDAALAKKKKPTAKK